MRYSLDFVDLQNPKVRRPPVRLEQRIMIGAEMSRCAFTMNGPRRSRELTQFCSPEVTQTWNTIRDSVAWPRRHCPDQKSGASQRAIVWGWEPKRCSLE